MGKALCSPAEMQAAIEKLRTEAESRDLQPHHIAAETLEMARKSNDFEQMRFWRAVWIQIMTDEYLESQPKPSLAIAPARRDNGR